MRDWYHIESYRTEEAEIGVKLANRSVEVVSEAWRSQRNGSQVCTSLLSTLSQKIRAVHGRY